jgi:hypothetical protein
MASSEAGSERSPGLTVEECYVQMCTDIRFTDDISLKLLGLIPLVSGAGILTVLFAGSERSRWEAALLGGFVGLFGAIVTFAVYRWECRNVDFCTFRRGQVEYLEKNVSRLSQHALKLDRPEALELVRPKAPLVCFGWHRKKVDTDGERLCFGWRRQIGKAAAERVLYTAVIVSWLALPGIAALLA